jgi:Protein of unknown function (DUF3168)
MNWLFWLPNLGMGASPSGTTAQLFEQALDASLNGISELTALVGTGIFTQALPQTWKLDADGPAITYSVPTKPRGHVLTGPDGTATARVQFDSWSLGIPGTQSAGIAKKIIEAIRNGIDGAGLQSTWGNGTVEIMSCIQQQDVDLDEEPQAGSDQWLYHVVSEYQIRYRVVIPTLT